MPTYDYRCDACGHTFSKIQRWSDPPVAQCPKCGSRPRRLVSVPAIVFKGSGWHVNDYRPKSSESSSEASGPQGTPKNDSAKQDTARDSTKKESAPAKTDAPAGNS